MKIIKRNGGEAEFDASYIESAIWKAVDATKDGDKELDKYLISHICSVVSKKAASLGHTPHVEEIQDMVISEIQNSKA